MPKKPEATVHHLFPEPTVTRWEPEGEKGIVAVVVVPFRDSGKKLREASFTFFFSDKTKRRIRSFLELRSSSSDVLLTDKEFYSLRMKAEKGLEKYFKQLPTKPAQ